MSLIEKAVLNNWFFSTRQGQMTVQDLNQLPLQTSSQNKASLENVAQALFEQIDTSSKVSFVDDVPPAQTELTERLDLVKQLIARKKAQNAAAADASARAKEKQKLLGLLADRKDAELSSLSVAELEAKIAALN